MSIFQARPKNITTNQSTLITNVKNTNSVCNKDYQTLAFIVIHGDQNNLTFFNKKIEFIELEIPNILTFLLI